MVWLFVRHNDDDDNKITIMCVFANVSRKKEYKRSSYQRATEIRGAGNQRRGRGDGITGG